MFLDFFFSSKGNESDFRDNLYFREAKELDMNGEKKYFAHETAVIDVPCEIGMGTKIWHFTHIMSNAVIGESCNIGQNVVVSPQVVLGKM